MLSAIPNITQNFYPTEFNNHSLISYNRLQIIMKIARNFTNPSVHVEQIPELNTCAII